MTITLRCPICPDPMPKEVREGSILDQMVWSVSAPIPEPCDHKFEYDKTRDAWFYIPEELPEQVKKAD